MIEQMPDGNFFNSLIPEVQYTESFSIPFFPNTFFIQIQLTLFIQFHYCHSCYQFGNRSNSEKVSGFYFLTCFVIGNAKSFGIYKPFVFGDGNAGTLNSPSS